MRRGGRRNGAGGRRSSGCGVVGVYAFPLRRNEVILKKGMASAQVEDRAGIGALYLTSERLVFVGYARTSITSTVAEEIPLEHIDAVRAVKTFALLDNAIDVTTIRGGHLRLTLAGRDGWVEMIREQMDKV